MKHYKSSGEWHFDARYPKRWRVVSCRANQQPPRGNPLRVVQGWHPRLDRFSPSLRSPIGAQRRLADEVQEYLTKQGFSNFVTGETTIGSRAE